MAVRKRGKSGRFKPSKKKRRPAKGSKATNAIVPIGKLQNLDKRVSRLELKTSTMARERLNRIRSKAEARRAELALASKYG